MKRSVEAEWLDALSADDPAARRSRRDLHLLNRLMGHAGILCSLLASRSRTQPPRRIIELGAGDGTLMLRVAKRFSQRWKGVELALVDSKPAVSEKTLAAFAVLGWDVELVVTDVADWLADTESGLADIIIANLFLHHFTEGELAQLLTQAETRTRMFIACEPRRAAFAFAMSRMLGAIGCNAVTRHDAPVSVRAGFAGKELSTLWTKSGWRIEEQPAHLFSHAFLAERLESFTPAPQHSNPP